MTSFVPLSWWAHELRVERWTPDPAGAVSLAITKGSQMEAALIKVTVDDNAKPGLYYAAITSGAIPAGSGSAHIVIDVPQAVARGRAQRNDDRRNRAMG